MSHGPLARHTQDISTHPSRWGSNVTPVALYGLVTRAARTVCLRAEEPVTVIDDEPGVLVQLSEVREVQGEAPMPDDVRVPSSS